MKSELTVEVGQKALADHVIEKGLEIRKKYGPVIDMSTLDKIIKDPECVRFPIEIRFESAKIEKEYFAVTEMVSDKPADGYIIYIHYYFKNKPHLIPALTLYHLVIVNYGDFATSHEAELFASTILGMDKDDYYKLLCSSVDSIGYA